MSTSQGKLSEDQIAEKLGVRAAQGDPSAKWMYTRLKNLELPDWLVYPEAPPDADEPDQVEGDEGREEAVDEFGPGRKARTTGEAVELPPAERAVALLRRQLSPEGLVGNPHSWQGSLEEDIEELYRLKEWLRGEYFVTVLYHGDDREIYYREELSVEVWRSLCEAQGLDPETTEAVEGPTNPSPLGASPMPWPGWVPLIALYALRNPSVEPLIEALHPEPASVNVADLYKVRNEKGARSNGIVTDLRVAAEKLAIVVRGGKVRRGPPSPEVSYYDLWVTWMLIEPLHRQGYTDEEIFEKLKAQGYPTKPVPTTEGTAFTVEEIRRLRSLPLSPPDEA